MRRIALVAALAAGLASRLPADFTYRQTTTISGAAAGAMAGRRGQLAAPGPMPSTIEVKNGRLLVRFAERSTLVDVNLQTVTQIDFTRRTYSVAGFDEIRRAQSGEGAAPQPAVRATGNRRQISGFDATELVMRVAAPGAATGPITHALWLAPAPAGYPEMRDLMRRISVAIEWSPWQNLFRARPEIARTLAALLRETAKADGMPVLEVTSIDQPPPPAGEPRSRLGAGNPLGQWAGGFGSENGPLFEIRAEMSAFSSGPLDEADFAIPPGYRRMPPEILQPAMK